jgi:tetratricopeptide (TPR) repeat protein
LDALLAKEERLFLSLEHDGTQLARFALPLDLPKRQAPARKPAPQTAAELARAGWDSYLFARFPEAEGHFRKALEADSKSTSAHTGLAFLRLDSDPKAAMAEARAAAEIDPQSGLAYYALAVAADRAGDRVTALDAAWKAALDPATATAARALVAKLELRFAGYRTAMEALGPSGPWQNDPLCRNLLAYACLKAGEAARAIALARENLNVDPLDSLAQSILWMADGSKEGAALRGLLENMPSVMELAAQHAAIAGDDWEPIHRLLEHFYLKGSLPRDSIASYWTARGFARLSNHGGLAQMERSAAALAAGGVFPHHGESVEVLKGALERNPKDGKAALYLGHLLFHLGRYSEGRELWRKAAELGAEPVVAFRALGMAAKTLDNDLKSARQWLEQANQAEARDAIVARDLANVLFALADQASETEKRALTVEARDRLNGAFEEGKGRSDFVALLARSHSRLGDHAETARLLDSVRITIWEGAHEAHDLFEEAHLALGDTHLAAGRPTEALAEFNRALEYPKNLATGKLENAREAHIHYRRGNALLAMGRKTEARTAWRLAADEPESDDARKREARAQAKGALERAGD